MIKNTVIALVAAASLVGVAAPAFADTNLFGDGNTTEQNAFIENSIVSQLQQKGINATGVEEWSGLVRAYVTQADGTQTMQFFTPTTLEQVNL